MELDILLLQQKTKLDCCRQSTSIILYILILIIPITSEAWPIIYYDDYEITKITILIHTCCLIILTVATGIRLYIGCDRDGSQPVYWPNYETHCSDCGTFCTSPAKFESMITGGYLFLVCAPWAIVNFICIGVWGNQLANNDLYIIILGVPVVIFLFVLSLVIGYGITKEFKNDEDG